MINRLWLGSCLIGRWLTLALSAMWWGGFTFYSVVVVPTGHQVLHSRIKQGFITQEVTHWLNLLGSVIVILLLVRFIRDRAHVPSLTHRYVIIISWGITAVTLVILIWMHPHLDSYLDQDSRSVIDDELFYRWHQWYLIVASLQWLACTVHLTAILKCTKQTRSMEWCKEIK